MIELVFAIMVLSIALLALMAGYDSAFMSLKASSHQAQASTLGNQQLELYSALPYASVGLDLTTLNSVKASNATYAADRTALNASTSGTDVTISGCGSSAQCSPVQTVTGSDHHSYTIETFIRDVTTFTSWSTRYVTVIVRDATASGTPKLASVTAAFDKGP